MKLLIEVPLLGIPQLPQSGAQCTMPCEHRFIIEYKVNLGTEANESNGRVGDDTTGL